MNSRKYAGITCKERDIIMKKHEISHLDWHNAIFKSGMDFLEKKHPKNLYAAKTERFWTWYNCIIADIEDEIIQRINYFESTKEVRGVVVEYLTEHLFNFLYEKGVNQPKLSKFQMYLINEEYRKKFGKIPNYYKPVKKRV